jgi:hypothetical protein
MYASASAISPAATAGWLGADRATCKPSCWFPVSTGLGVRFMVMNSEF